jgi:DNA-binding NtrC family response regulator
MPVQKILNMRIDIVDDELIVLKTLESFLNDLGHQVKIFSSVSELLVPSVENELPAHVILLDATIPHGKGGQALRDIHQHYPEADIIIMSGHNQILPLQEALAQGVYGYLNKPIRLGELELLLIRLSESRANLQSRSGTTKD